MEKIKKRQQKQDEKEDEEVEFNVEGIYFNQII